MDNLWKGNPMFEDKISFDFKTMQTIIKKIAFIDSFKGKWEILIGVNHRLSGCVKSLNNHVMHKKFHHKSSCLRRLKGG